MPRCGTHFIWSRYMQSGRYQLIYDADRIPALSILARECQEKLDFLYPAPINPNYNFQYNSLSNIDRILTAKEHLGILMAEHECSTDNELFKRIMLLQDCEPEERSLLSINRFIYTTSYDFLFRNFEWTIENAVESLGLLHSQFASSGYDPVYVMVIRNIPDWIDSQVKMYGKIRKDLIIRRTQEIPIVLGTCFDLDIPIYYMKDVIRNIKDGKLDFEIHMPSISRKEIDEIIRNLSSITMPNMGAHPKYFWGTRFIQYFREKDAIKRTSLVRSIGTSRNVLERIPIIGKQIRDDYNGIILNNAKLRNKIFF